MKRWRSEESSCFPKITWVGLTSKSFLALVPEMTRSLTRGRLAQWIKTTCGFISTLASLGANWWCALHPLLPLFSHMQNKMTQVFIRLLSEFTNVFCNWGSVGREEVSAMEKLWYLMLNFSFLLSKMVIIPWAAGLWGLGVTQGNLQPVLAHSRSSINNGLFIVTVIICPEVSRSSL